MKTIFSAAAAGALALALLVQSAFAEEPLKIDDNDTAVTIDTEDGAVEIIRKKTDAALIGGVLQPMVPVPGVTPVGELEVLDALKTGSAKVVDMRTAEWRSEATIPGSIHLPYIEVASRLDELGCTGEQGNWSCADAVNIIAFCNGPACGQSPIAMKAMVREGYPAEKIFYYRGGMQNWTVLGLTVAEGMF